MIADSVPAAEAIVWTMLFSWIVESLEGLSTAIEMTAAGIEVAKVRPILRPEVDVGGREHDGDERSEDNPAKREFLDGAYGTALSRCRQAIPPSNLYFVGGAGLECLRTTFQPSSSFTHTSVRSTQSSISPPRYLTRHFASIVPIII